MKMARPGGHCSKKRSCYSEQKRMNCLIYQTITTPNDVIFALYGSDVGCRHDVTLLRESGTEYRLRFCLFISGRQLNLYADAADMLRPWIKVYFPRTGPRWKKNYTIRG